MTATLDSPVTFQEDRPMSVSVHGSGRQGVVRFAPVLPFEITVPAGAGRGYGTFMLTPIPNQVYDYPETVEVRGTWSVGSAVRPATVDLVDDRPPGVDLSADAPEVFEGDGPTKIQVTATLDSPVTFQEDRPMSVSVHGSGRQGVVRFAPVLPFEITVPAGADRGYGTFTLTPISDPVSHASETVEVRGTSQDEMAIDPAYIMLRDAGQPSVSLILNPGSIEEDEGSSTVTTMLSQPAWQDVVIAIDVQPEESPLPGVGAITLSPNREVRIPNGETRGTGVVTITASNDGLYTGNRNAIVRGVVNHDVRGLEHPPDVTLTILDDETRPTGIALTVEPDDVIEGDPPRSMVVTATFQDGDSMNGDIEVVVTLAEGTAQRGADFLAEPQEFPVIIPRNAMAGTKEFLMDVIEDPCPEFAETVLVEGRVQGTPGLDVTPAELTIFDDDQEVEIRPNPFTPNGDGFNDCVRFNVGLQVDIDPELEIYNLEGVPVYVSSNARVSRCYSNDNASSARVSRCYSNDNANNANLTGNTGNNVLYWDGRSGDGEDQPPGLYLFVVRDAGSALMTGHVTLAR